MLTSLLGGTALSSVPVLLLQLGILLVQLLFGLLGGLGILGGIPGLPFA